MGLRRTLSILGVAIPTINAALEGRILSAIKDERVAASKLLSGPAGSYSGDREACQTGFARCAAIGDDHLLCARVRANARGVQGIRLQPGRAGDRPHLEGWLHYPGQGVWTPSGRPSRTTRTS